MMDPVSIFLLTVAGVFIVGVLGEVIFRRTQIPDAIWLVGVGIVLGPVTGFLPREWLLQIAPFFAAITLIVILFDGGRHLRAGELGRSALPATGLALLTFAGSFTVVTLITMAAAAAGWIPQPWSLHHSLLLGAILGGSSSVVIMPSMTLGRVETRTAAVVSLESAITDVLCVVGAATIMHLMLSGTESTAPLMVMARTFGIGLGFGAAAGAIWILILGLLRGNSHAFPLTLSGLFLLYVLVNQAGGSAALAVLTFAVLVGNASWLLARARLAVAPPAETEASDFYGQLVFIVKSFFFTFIGAMLGPPWGYVAMGVLLGLVLLPARLPGAWLAGLALRMPRRDRLTVAVALPRGLAAGVLATLPAAAGIPGTQMLPMVVFPAVVTTILIFTVGFRWARQGRADGENVPPDSGAAILERASPVVETHQGPRPSDVVPSESSGGGQQT